MPTGVPYLPEPLDDYPTGAVTQVLQHLDQPLSNADEKIFDAVLEQLTAKAQAALRHFPQFQENLAPHDLVNQFQVNLLTNLSAADVRNRRHFLALAAQNFRWILLDLAKSKANGQTEIVVEPVFTGTGPATSAQRKLDLQALFEFIENELEGEDRDILDLRALHGLTYRQIAQEVDSSTSTVERRYQDILRRLREHFLGNSND